ncbi:unnamed protein product [Urochloa decumbens]|uniref:Uncharacterized protein n=1 Tax=Urochloa decumbens TaxID=240449 RepID=A0ABC9CEG7_9POAL
MENEGQVDNNGQGIDLGLNNGNETTPLHGINKEEYDVVALHGAEDHMKNTDQDEDNNEPSSENGKPRFTPEQIQELESLFQECSHPDDEIYQDIASMVDLEASQVKFWFQSRHTQMQVNAVEDENNDIRQQNNKLLAENKKLQQQLLPQPCGRCRHPTNEKWRLSSENISLSSTYLRAQENLIKLVHDANLPPSVTMQRLASASLNQVPLTYNGSTDQAALLSYSKRALKEFMMLAVKEEPIWLPTMKGKMLNYQEYRRNTFPGLLGPRPQGFVMEATKDATIVAANVSGIVDILTDVTRWSKMFPGIIEGVKASKVVSSGISDSRDGLIQELLQINADFWVPSPSPPNRRVKFLRISKQVENKWAVVDVSIDGNRGILPAGRRISLGYTSCRLLPSGCLLEDMNNGTCKVTWVVHTEYDDTAVPPLFRQLFQSGQALGSVRWLSSLQRHCVYMAVLRSSQLPFSFVSGAAISVLGRRSILALAQRMTTSFYTVVSKPVIQIPGTIVKEWRGSCGTAAEMSEATVHIIIGNCSTMGKPPSPVLSATMTVWLPGTPPQRVHEYLCNVQRRGEWDTFANATTVKKLSSVTTCPQLRGNCVSILEANDVADLINSNKLILQQEINDVSCSLVVYSFIEKHMIHAVTNGVDTSVFLLPSGFVVLPDGHGKPHRNAGASSSRAPTGPNGTAGSLLTAAYQALLPGTQAIHAAETFDNAGNRVCDAINQILAAVGADIAVPA